MIGVWQCGALIPGISRSGATIVGGLLRGIDHEGAAHFSFLIAPPIILGATALEVPKLLRADMPAGTLQLSLVAAAVAGVTALALHRLPDALVPPARPLGADAVRLVLRGGRARQHRGAGRADVEEGKRFFFEKKKQKTFASLVPNVARVRIFRIKVFLLLFLQKKKTLPSFEVPMRKPALCLLAALALGAAAPRSPRPMAATPLSRTDLPWWQRPPGREGGAAARGPRGPGLVRRQHHAGLGAGRPGALAGLRPRLAAASTATATPWTFGFNGDTTAHLLWRIENGEAAGISPQAWRWC